MTNTIERLDYSKPPPGYALAQAAHGFLFFDRTGERHGAAMRDLGHDWHRDAARAKAWVYYKARSDPPRFLVTGDEEADSGEGGNAAWLLPEGLTSDSITVYHDGFTTTAAARADAWAWYDRRLGLANRLAARADFDGARTNACPWWPRCLTWSNDQVTEVKRWLVDSTAEMPEVIRG